MSNSYTTGQIIESLRKEKGLTQEQLGKALYVSRETVVKWESDERDIKTKDMIKLAKYFDVSADYLLGLTPNKTTDTNVKAVCEYTGLSESAVEYLTSIKESDISQRMALDYLLYSADFHRAVYYFAQSWRTAGKVDYNKTAQEAYKRLNKEANEIEGKPFLLVNREIVHSGFEWAATTNFTKAMRKTFERPAPESIDLAADAEREDKAIAELAQQLIKAQARIKEGESDGE